MVTESSVTTIFLYESQLYNMGIDKSVLKEDEAAFKTADKVDGFKVFPPNIFKVLGGDTTSLQPIVQMK